MSRTRLLLIFALLWLAIFPAPAPAGSNRISHGSAAYLGPVNALDQALGRHLMVRGFGLTGIVKPGTTEQAVTVNFTSNIPGTNGLLSPDPSGRFSAWYLDLAPTANALWVDGLVTATRAHAGLGDKNAVAERCLRLLLPPGSETLAYDFAGRLHSDGFWTYTWNGASRLIKQERQPATLPPELQAETVEFRYDANGRRVSTTRKLTYQAALHLSQRIETSNVLWAGWLPIMEERTVTGGPTTSEFPAPRRWFQWGPDLSGTFDGAGGIGGLMAIHEELLDGTALRTLLPVTDGLGNICAVLNSATGALVAEFSFGPFGEPLGEVGETDACPFRWQSKWYTPTSGQYYFGYRVYDPRFGRWLSRDPLGEAGGFNLYAYCGNDPVNKHDYLGMAEIVISNGEVFVVGDPKKFSTAIRIGSVGENSVVNFEPWTGLMSSSVNAIKSVKGSLDIDVLTKIAVGQGRNEDLYFGIAVKGFTRSRYSDFDAMEQIVGRPTYRDYKTLSAAEAWTDGRKQYLEDSLNLGELGSALYGAVKADYIRGSAVNGFSIPSEGLLKNTLFDDKNELHKQVAGSHWGNEALDGLKRTVLVDAPLPVVTMRVPIGGAARTESIAGTVEEAGSVFPKGYQGGPGAMWVNEGRGLWKLTAEGADKVMGHRRFGTFYRSSSDGLWWAADNAGHGGSAFKVFRETGKGLEWFRDADQFGDFIIGKHKGATGQFIPWSELKGR